jgi:hypothetical protein
VNGLLVINKKDVLFINLAQENKTGYTNKELKGVELAKELSILGFPLVPLPFK